MKRNRLDELEKKVERLAQAVNRHQSLLDFLQNTNVGSSTVEQLSSAPSTGGIKRSFDIDINKVQISEAMKPVLRELIKDGGKWLSAEQIAQTTKRSKNLESSYMHRLFEKGYLIRQRIGRNVYYSICRDAHRWFLED